MTSIPQVNRLKIDNMRSYKRLEIIVNIVVIAAFCITIAWVDNNLRKNDSEELRKHAHVIENDLWDLNTEGPQNYLKLATQLSNYEQLVVYTAESDIFCSVKGEKSGPFDQFLSTIGLIPKIPLRADITHNGTVIGTMEAIHRHDNIYIYFYLFLLLGLFLLAFRFFIRLLLTNQTLDLRIHERTEELATEKERLAVTLRSMGDAVIATDIVGKVVMINKVAEKLSGWTQQEATDKQIEDVFKIINEKTGTPCENPVQKAIKTGQIIELANHTILIARDESQYIIEDSCAPIFDKNSNIIGTVLVFRDVTIEKKTEEELFKAKKLESVGILAGGIAHDFNNILTAILGNIELAQCHVEPTDRTHNLLGEAIKASLRARDLTKQLLTFAKGGDPVKQTASIATIITDSANFVLHGSSIRCSYNIPSDLWPVNVDSGQIGQVIQNIAINARQAMPEGGTLEICCENLPAGGQSEPLLQQGDHIKVTIADSGPGIPAPVLEKIFDPYFTTKSEGSGLGLAICHSIIKKHDGNIHVHSETNKGTVFTLFLPVAKSTTISVALDKPTSTPTNKNRTIMIMDDEIIIRDLTEQMLTLSGHNVLSAKNGQEAIDIYADYFNNGRAIDIIIMDLTIPGGMGGEEAMKEVLTIDPNAKGIVASGYSNDPVMANYQDYGFKGSIPKPFQFSELNKLINDILG